MKPIEAYDHYAIQHQSIEQRLLWAKSIRAIDRGEEKAIQLIINEIKENDPRDDWEEYLIEILQAALVQLSEAIASPKGKGVISGIINFFINLFKKKQ